MATCPHENDAKACVAVRRTGPPGRCLNCKSGRANEEKLQGIKEFPQKEKPPGSGRVKWEEMDEKPRQSAAVQGQAKQRTAEQSELPKEGVVKNPGFREGVQDVGNEALTIVREYFSGKRQGTDKVKEAVRMIGFGLKVEHMNQIAEFSNKSLALRLVKFLPKDVDKDQYIHLTNPQLRPMLMAKPKKELG